MTTMDNNHHNSNHFNRLHQQTSSKTLPNSAMSSSTTLSLSSKMPSAATISASHSSATGAALTSGAVLLRPNVHAGHLNQSTSTHSSSGSKSFRNHQRRQSVARLLPDISKLRLLSWLVEASSELINCNIAIMDGVYAKLNKSQESSLFWSNNSTGLGHHSSQATQNQSSSVLNNNHNSNNNISSFVNRPPPTPLLEPVANKIVISQQKQQQGKKKRERSSGCPAARTAKSSSSTSSRNHHSLPLTNYDASSMAAVSFISAGSSSLSRRSIKTNLDSDSYSHLQSTGANVNSNIELDATISPTTIMPLNSLIISEDFNNNNNNNSDSNPSDLDEEYDDEEDDNSSAASSTTSSGIHGGGTSSLSSSSSASSSNNNNNNNNKKAGLAGLSLRSNNSSKQTNSRAASSSVVSANNTVSDINNSGRFISSAEQLSEKIRRTVMEHNYIQNLLVNIIRQHDKQRDQLNQQQIRRRQMSYDNNSSMSSRQVPNSAFLNQQHYFSQHQKIDLADIADSLDDGCLCLCHSEQQHRDRAIRCLLLNNELSSSSGKSSTLPATSTTTILSATPTAPSGSNNQQLLQLQLEQLQRQQQIVAGNNQVPARKVRRLKKLRGGFGSNSNSGNSNELSKQELIDRLSDKLCENCFETHYWLHGASCSDELLLLQPLIHQFNYNSNNDDSQEFQLDQLNTIITKRNATFIKLVQQEVRSTISKSIELTDLIRKEIKSPESIKQKQLMRYFSTSIQLLTSVGNYVVPAQDISSFIPDIGQHQTSLFSLPSSDFDHLLLYPSSPALVSSHFNSNQQANNNYHLASAPEIPVRRKFLNPREQQATSSSLTLDNQAANKSRLLASDNYKKQVTAGNNDQDGVIPEQQTAAETTTTSAAQHQQTSKLKTVESSSGASSNNSSASSSIARGAVQQSSLTRAQTSNAILDGKTSHDLSYDAIASLSRQQTEDDMLFQSRPKFWHSSKFNFIKKLLHVKEQRLLRQQSKDRRIYNNKVQNKFRLVMMDLTHFNKSQQLLTTENGVNSLLTSMRNVLEFGLYLTLKLY